MAIVQAKKSDSVMNKRTVSQAENILKETYGYPKFRGDQEAIINSVISGEDSLVLMPTGGGKSLCYQIPSLVRPGVGLVISPLIALMQDQVVSLQQLGIKAAFLNSSLSQDQQNEVESKLDSGEIEILYMSPERVVLQKTLALLGRLTLSVVAIDEAHCVSQWGHDFRQDYLSLGVLGQCFPDIPRIALTATADPRTRSDIVERLSLNQPQIFVSGFDRPNIRYSVKIKSDPRSQLLRFLTAHRGDAGIVYCMSRKKVEATAEWLVTHGFDALPYHAGLGNDIRAKNQDRFLREDGVVVVATIAFGMGIDKPDVRFVAHLDLPKSVEAYYQETGRAGRDDQPAEAWMVYGLQDVVRLSQMLESSEADEQHKRIERNKLDALLGWCEATQCRRKSLLAYFGEVRDEDCGNCDVCIKPPDTWDATVAAQKLLSCVYRTGQRFGAGHVIDVLLGKETHKAHQYDHHRLKVFGLGQDYSANQWRSVIRQLMVRGLLRAETERFGALMLTEDSRPLLRGEISLQLREDLKEPALRKRPARKSNVSVADEGLWEALRQCRKKIADEQGVPPYVIFHDATLMGMMEYRPRSPEEMLAISGIGQTKLDRYGVTFLEVIQNAQDI